MKYNLDIWTDLSEEEKKVYHIYLAFQKRTSKLGMVNKWLPSAFSKSFDPELPAGAKIRTAKNWAFFAEVYEIFKDYPEFDEEIFMDSVFRNLNKKSIFPAQLRTQRIIKNYLDYRMKLKMSSKISDQKKIMTDIANSYRYIKTRLKLEKLNSDNIYTYFNEVKDNNVVSDGLLACIHELISPFYYCISKSFEIAYRNSDLDIREEIISADRIQNIRAFVRMKRTIFEFAKTVFGDDIINE